MTITEPAPTETTDALHRVHHHYLPEDEHLVLAGEPVTALCGIVKRRSGDVSHLPCCPLCAEIIHTVYDGYCAVGQS